MTPIFANLQAVGARLDGAARAAGRPPKSIRLLAVSKTKPAEDVVAAVAAIPGLSMVAPEATYLAWIDARESGVADPAAACEAAGLGLSDGKDFGAPGFLRLNFGCPRATLDQALERLARAFSPAGRD